MNIFISYASEDKNAAEQIYFALTGDAHTVFFDQSSLPPGGDYNSRIRQAMDDSDLFIFLISPDSTSENAYALTELKFAEDRWPHPKDALLPVMARATPYETIPNYLKAVTVLEAQGNLAAEVAAWVNKKQKGLNPFGLMSNGAKGIALVFGLIVALALLYVVFLRNEPAEPIAQPQPQPQIDSQSEGTVAGIDLPAFAVLDSAWESKGKAQRRLVELGHNGYSNTGFFWIPDFEFLSGAELYQVYIGPFADKSKAIQGVCQYNRKFSKTTYGVKLSVRPGRTEIRCSD